MILNFTKLFYKFYDIENARFNIINKTAFSNFLLLLNFEPKFICSIKIIKKELAQVCSISRSRNTIAGFTKSYFPRPIRSLYFLLA